LAFYVRGTADAEGVQEYMRKIFGPKWEVNMGLEKVV
jgi:hypothetical protein